MWRQATQDKLKKKSFKGRQEHSVPACDFFVINTFRYICICDLNFTRAKIYIDLIDNIAQGVINDCNLHSTYG